MRVQTLFVLFILSILTALPLLLFGAARLPEAAEEKPQSEEPAMPAPKLNQLTPEEKRVILDKGTEAPNTGAYTDFFEEGLYACRQCNALLFRSKDKFHSACGWPAFDDEIPGAVEKKPDADGRRTEIVCATCGGHLGHVFTGERFTEKNLRHCVNSISMTFIPADKVKLGRAIFAGGCFWGVEHLFEEQPGVLDARAGYIGGTVEKPTYEQVCSHATGHAEAVEVLFDPVRTNFGRLARRFFEIHDPTQVNRQGPDVGSQYRSAVFYLDAAQKAEAERLIDYLKSRGMKVATTLEKATAFWPAEQHHQDYVKKHGRACHRPTPRDWSGLDEEKVGQKSGKSG